jgi:tetratricopeptide (TPR) repeat protein
VSVLLALGLAAIATASVLVPVVGGHGPAIDPAPPGASNDPDSDPGIRRSRAKPPVIVLAIAVVVAVAMGAFGSIAPRTANAPLTGSVPGTASSVLDGARADFQAGRLPEAAEGYLSVLRTDPSNAEASARLGLILALSGRPAAGMKSILRARQTDPSYAEAELLQAVVQLRVLDRPVAAIRTLSDYLRTAAQPDLPAAHALLRAARSSLE